MERYHIQVIQGLQSEVNEAQGLNMTNKSTWTECPDVKDEVQTHADNNNKDSSQYEGYSGNSTGVKYVKVPLANSHMGIHHSMAILSSCHKELWVILCMLTIHVNLKGWCNVTKNLVIWTFTNDCIVQVEQVTWLPEGPTAIVVDVRVPVMPPTLHWFGLLHQSATSITQCLPSLIVLQPLCCSHMSFLLL
jgi:hypothetical protein